MIDGHVKQPYMFDPTVPSGARMKSQLMSVEALLDSMQCMERGSAMPRTSCLCSCLVDGSDIPSAHGRTEASVLLSTFGPATTVAAETYVATIATLADITIIGYECGCLK